MKDCFGFRFSCGAGARGLFGRGIDYRGLTRRFWRRLPPRHPPPPETQHYFTAPGCPIIRPLEVSFTKRGREDTGTGFATTNSTKKPGILQPKSAARWKAFLLSVPKAAATIGQSSR